MLKSIRIDLMIYLKINTIYRINENGITLIKRMEKYTKEEVIILVKQKLIESFGKITSTGYTIIGVITDAIPDDCNPLIKQTKQ